MSTPASGIQSQPDRRGDRSSTRPRSTGWRPSRIRSGPSSCSSAHSLLAWLAPENNGAITGFLADAMGFVKVLLLIGGIGSIVYNVVAWRTAHYSVTNRRVLGRDGLIRRRSTDTMLSSINDVQLETSVLGRSLGTGTSRSSRHPDGWAPMRSPRSSTSRNSSSTSWKPGNGSTGKPTTPSPAPAIGRDAGSAPRPHRDRDRCDGDARQPGSASRLGRDHGRGVRGQEGGAPQPDLRRPRRGRSSALSHRPRPASSRGSLRPWYANSGRDQLPDGRPHERHSPAVRVASSSSSCANVSTIASAAPVPAASRAPSRNGARA